MSTAAAPKVVQSHTPENTLPALRELDREVEELEKQFLSGGLQKTEYEKKLLLLKKRHKEAFSKLELLKTDPEASKQLRFALYANRDVQVLLSGFIGGMIKELAPTFDPDRKARYPILENIDASINPNEVLDELAYSGILVKRLYERLARCPRCSSHSSVFLRLKCPDCGSMELDSSKLIEHLVCGAVHEFEEFASYDQIRCPSCQEPLAQEGEDYRVVGTFSRCESCRIHFDEPEKRFVCRTCQEEFDIKDATYYDTYTYSMNENLLAEVKGIIGLPMFKGALEEVGFRVELPGSVTGSSSMIHTFTLAGEKDSKTVVVDVVESEGEVDEKELFAFYTKVMDLKSTLGIFVAVPRLSPRAREFATKSFSRNDVTYIEANSPLHAAEQLKVKVQQFA
jgi:hypothetical protein